MTEAIKATDIARERRIGCLLEQGLVVVQHRIGIQVGITRNVFRLFRGNSLRTQGSGKRECKHDGQGRNGETSKLERFV
jgi:hypothetical protein